MLVVLINNQVLSPHCICQTCPLADREGQPRWRKGELRCGHLLSQLTENVPPLYECEMGFRIANVQ
jgi:hypothetical protein